MGGRDGRFTGYGIVLETVPPAEMGAALAADAAKKAKFGAIHLLIRGFLCTPFLAYGARWYSPWSPLAYRWARPDLSSRLATSR